MKREKRLTKKERKEQSGGEHHHDQAHIHCVACGRHIDQKEFQTKPATAMMITCAHGSQFPSCTGCEGTSRYLIDEHDRTGKAVNQAPAYH
jgi:hypothetical protein